MLVCTPAGFERHWARLAAEAAGVEPPQWALQPIPDVTVVGPQISAHAGGRGSRAPPILEAVEAASAADVLVVRDLRNLHDSFPGRE